MSKTGRESIRKCAADFLASNNNNNDKNETEAWQRDLQILRDLNELEGREEEEMSRTRADKDGSNYTQKLPRQIKLCLKLPEENISGPESKVIKSCGSELSLMDLNDKLRMLANILAGLSNKLESLEKEEQRCQLQRDALCTRLDKVQERIQELKFDPLPCLNPSSTNNNFIQAQNDGCNQAENPGQENCDLLQKSLTNNVIINDNDEEEAVAETDDKAKFLVHFIPAIHPLFQSE